MKKKFVRSWATTFSTTAAHLTPVFRFPLPKRSGSMGKRLKRLTGHSPMISRYFFP